MFKENQHNHKSYSIALKSQSGNTVGYINLTSQFLKAVVGKQAESVTVADIEAINNGNFAEFLQSLTVEVSGVDLTSEPVQAKDF